MKEESTTVKANVQSSATPNGSTTETEQWDVVIIPRQSLLDLRLDEVWCYRDLLV